MNRRPAVLARQHAGHESMPDLILIAGVSAEQISQPIGTLWVMPCLSGLGCLRGFDGGLGGLLAGAHISQRLRVHDVGDRKKCAPGHRGQQPHASLVPGVRTACRVVPGRSLPFTLRSRAIPSTCGALPGRQGRPGSRWQLRPHSSRAVRSRRGTGRGWPWSRGSGGWTVGGNLGGPGRRPDRLGHIQAAYLNLGNSTTGP